MDPLPKQNNPLATPEKPRLVRYPSKSNLNYAFVKQQHESQQSDSGSRASLDSTNAPRILTKDQFSRSSHLLSDVPGSSSLLWDLMSTYISNDVPTIQKQISDHVEYTLARDRSNFDSQGAYQATAFSVHDRLIEFWNDTNFRLQELNPKQVYYLSIEFLLGRSLQNALLNLDIESNYTRALKELGYSLENIYDKEMDAGEWPRTTSRYNRHSLPWHSLMLLRIYLILIHIRSWQWWSRPSSCLLSRLDGNPQLRCMGLWNSIHLRDVSTGNISRSFVFVESSQIHVLTCFSLIDCLAPKVGKLKFLTFG